MMRTWWENEEILRQFRQWLTETCEEIESLDASATGGLLVGDDDADSSSPPLQDAGLMEVVEALTAMRHELKLQTKSSRGLEEAVETARIGLAEAMRQFQSIQAHEEEEAERAVLPLVEAMAGLDEALWRGKKAFEATRRQMINVAPGRLRKLLQDDFQRLPWWRRWLVGPWQARVEQQCAATLARVNSEEFDRLVKGYSLLQDRVGREMHAHGLRRIDTVGHKVDPRCMTVVELADLPEALPETVEEELRPGYTWHGKVVRCAEVRAVASVESGDRQTIESATSVCERIEG